jgi:hypothetical protein
MRGAQVLGAAKSYNQAVVPLVVALSSSAQPSDIDHAYELGANSFIQKTQQFEQPSLKWHVRRRSLCPFCEGTVEWKSDCFSRFTPHVSPFSEYPVNSF